MSQGKVGRSACPRIKEMGHCVQGWVLCIMASSIYAGNLTENLDRGHSASFLEPEHCG